MKILNKKMRKDLKSADFKNGLKIIVLIIFSAFINALLFAILSFFIHFYSLNYLISYFVSVMFLMNMFKKWRTK